MGSIDIIRSKDLYELEASEVRVNVAIYRGDNGIYKPAVFQNELKRRHQKMNFSVVGAHGHSLVTEQVIGTVVNSSRMVTLHQALLWTEYFDMMLRPFVIEHAA